MMVKRRPGLDSGLIGRLVKVFKQEGVTVVHTHSLDPMFYVGWAVWITSVPVRIHTQHNTWGRTYNWKDHLKFRVSSKLYRNY
ncbi:MAG: glycosyltransferase [Nitrospira sp.]|nr:glycosyltransferase [Nitrospira sp.]